MKSKSFQGPFAQQLKMLLVEKRVLGLKYEEEERLMHVFDDMSCSHKCSVGLSKDLVLSFIKRQPHWSQRTQSGRIHLIRQIAKFLCRKGIQAYVCDTGRVMKINNQFTPYIFSKRQIANIFYQADTIPDLPQSRNAPIFYPVILRILYGCGLRISEALNLTVRDVNRDEGLLFVHNSKNHKDRILPMNATLVRYCIDYYNKVHLFPVDTDYFFKSPVSHGKYNKSSVYHYFRKLLWQCGISHGGRGGSGPRLHDLRHTFCVHSLQQFLKNGVNYSAALPLLSAYMGHSSIAATGKYLRLTAEAFPEITEKMEQHLGHLIPEMEVV